MKARLWEWPHALAVFTIVMLCLESDRAAAQEFGNGAMNGHLAPEAFTFVRVEWQGMRMGYGMRGIGRGPLWAHDYPIAEQNFYVALDAVTSIPLTFDSKVLALEDEAIFDFPFLYICEVGYWAPSEQETALLKEYLNRGGFLLVDDFRGDFEWHNFLSQMRQIAPRSPQSLTLDHPIFHCFFDFEQLGEHSPYWGMRPNYLAIFDDQDRMVVLINHNNDIGDGWEWPESYGDFSTEAFKLGVNYLIYAMTH